MIDLDAALDRIAQARAGLDPAVAQRAALNARASQMGIDPRRTFRAAEGVEPLEWQEDLLTSVGDVLALKGRQIGASTAVASLALHWCVHRPGYTAIVVSPSQDQSKHILTKARRAVRRLMDAGVVVDRLVEDSTLRLGLANGSRLLSLPGTATSVRGYSADLLIVDEADFVDEETIAAATPTTAATGGRTIMLTTPNPARPYGPFRERWDDTGTGWTKLRVPSRDVPTIDPAFLERERRRLGEASFRLEYEAEFGLLAGVALFDEQRLAAAASDVSL